MNHKYRMTEEVSEDYFIIWLNRTTNSKSSKWRMKEAAVITSSGFWTYKVSYSPGGVYNDTVGVTRVFWEITHHLNCFVWFLTFTSIRDLKQRFQLRIFFQLFFKFMFPWTTTLQHTIDLIIHAVPPINAESSIGKAMLIFSDRLVFGNPFRHV